jgi:AraC-like DNA-binding protein
MMLVDLIGSINHALPQLAVASAQRAFDDEILGPNIGYAFLRPTRADATEPFDIGGAEMWSSLRSTTVGILGTGAIGDAVVRMAHARSGADGVCHHWDPGSEPEGSVGVRRQTFARVLEARVLCVALPWSEAMTAQVRDSRLAPVNAHTLLVAWRRSPAIERALVYLGHHYVEPILLRNLAAVACTSKFHLVRLFAATLGITPHRYQLLLRLARAKALLREGAPITQIAHGLGFADHSHLNRSFRMLMGMTPTQYQQSIESEGAISF